MLVKWLSCCHLLSACCVCSFRNKDLFEIFLFLSNNCQKTGNMTTRTEIINLCIQVSENSTNFPEKWKFYQKSTTHQSWKVSNDTFLPKPSMTNSVHRKLKFGSFPHLTHFVFVLKVWERFWSYKKIKIVKCEGGWEELWAKTSLHRQSWTKYLKQSKEIQQNWKGKLWYLLLHKF